jgi:hypothetical protein
MEDFYPFIYEKIKKEDDLPMYAEIEYYQIKKEIKENDEECGVIVIQIL